MPASYSSAPISGFTGHIPGAKWQVGSRYIPPTRASQPETTASIAPSAASYIEHSASRNDHHGAGENQNHNHGIESTEDDRSNSDRPDPIEESGHRSVQFSPDQVPHVYLDRNPNGIDSQYRADSQLSLLRPGTSEMSIIYNSEGFPVRVIKNSQASHSAASDSHSLQTLSSPGSEHLRNALPSEPSPQATTRPPSKKQRAKSLPRRPPLERDPFEGLESGWWSKGEVLRNKERRELADSGKMIAGGDYSQRPETPKPQSRWKERQDYMDSIPAAGYSGHMPGLRHVGIGKSFNTAAREARRDYVLRRRAQSGEKPASTSYSHSSENQDNSYNESSRNRKSSGYSKQQ